MGALERDVRGKKTRLSERIWGSGCRRWPWGAAHGGAGGSGKRSLAHLARVGETFDWLAGEDDVRGVPAADHAIRKGVAVQGPDQQLPAHPVQLADVAPPEAAQERPQSLPSRKRGVEGALTMHPSTGEVRPARSASASSMQSPPASAEANSVSSLSPAFARPGASPR